MQLISEIEIAYFRSFYKFKLRRLSDLNVIFGKNDSGKSNIVRALSLFFTGSVDHTNPYDFLTDFCDQRLEETENNDELRKFLYVKVTFKTPQSYEKSLGKTFFVKRQWTVSRGSDYLETVSGHIKPSQKHIVTRLLNKIRFIYIPAIKDLSIFEMLLANIYDTLANATEFEKAIGKFSEDIQELTKEMFATLPGEVSGATKIGAPTRMSQLFRTLDFETTASGSKRAKSLTRQRGDGVKARHIPELLSYISENDEFEFHVWGFEEPENSLDFVAAQAEAKRLLAISKMDSIQTFLTTHSPSFYLLEDEGLSRCYVEKDGEGVSQPLQGNEIDSFDADQALQEGFYLPAVARALKTVAAQETRLRKAEREASSLQEKLRQATEPVVLTEGKTDAIILKHAWSKLYDKEMPFQVRGCDTGAEQTGTGNGGADNLAICLRAVSQENSYKVIGIFDYDDQGLKAYKLDKNFTEHAIDDWRFKSVAHGKSNAIIIPKPDFRKDCVECENMPIEFLFRDEHLEVEVEGERLELRPKKVSRTLGSRQITMCLEDFTHFKDIVGNKTHFAKKIVPSLPREAFEAFADLFKQIQIVLNRD